MFSISLSTRAHCHSHHPVSINDEEGNKFDPKDTAGKQEACSDSLGAQRYDNELLKALMR